MDTFGVKYGIHRKWKRALLAGTASLAFAGAGVSAGGLVLSSQALANEECGSGSQTTIACGSGPFGQITYDGADLTGTFPKTFEFANTEVTGVTVGSGQASGVVIITDNDDEAVEIFVNQVGVNGPPDINGGTVDGFFTSGDAHGLFASTAGANSSIKFEMNAGSISGGGSGGLSDAFVNGVYLTTSGDGADVDFDLNGGTISGGSGLLSPNSGVMIVTGGANAGINAATAAGTTINGGEGADLGALEAAAGMSLATTGGSNIFANISGDIVAGAEVLGVGYAGGLIAQATGGDGNVDLTVGSTSTVSGSANGVFGYAEGAGPVTINVYGNVNQTSADADSVWTIIPVGVAGVADDSGDVEINTHAGSNVSAAGEETLTGIGSIGILGSSDSGNTNMNIQGNVQAMGIGVAGTSDSGNATVTVGGDVDVTGTASAYISPLGLLSGSTVGIGAQSGTGAATANLFGGNVLGNTPDIGMIAHVFDGTENATINIGDGTEQASTVNANVIGLYGFNGGTGDTVIDYDNLDPESDQNTVNSDGVGVLALSGEGDVIVNSGITNSNIGGGGGVEGSGIIGAAFDGGNVTLNLNDKTSVADGGLFGALAVSIDGNATINVNAAIDPPIIGAMSVAIGAGNATTDVNAMIQADGLGAGAIQFGTGNAVITTDAAIESDFMGVGALKSGDSGFIDIDVNQSISGLTGANVADTAIQAVSVEHDGDVFVTTGNGLTPTDGSDGGTLMADNDGINVYKLFGGGNIDIDVNADINAGDQAIDIARSISGPGDFTINVNVDGYSTLTAGNNGIEIDNVDANNDINVEIAYGSSVLADDGSAVIIETFSDSGNNDVSVVSDGLLRGEGDGVAPTVGVITDGNATVTNTANGTIRSDANLWDDSAIVALADGDIEINNTGLVRGRMSLSSSTGDTTINNEIGSSGTWETSGENIISSTTGDATLNNLEGSGEEAVIITSGETLFDFSSPLGMSVVNNSGEIYVNGETWFGNSTDGIDYFDNANGLISMVNGVADYGVDTIPSYNSGVGDVTVIAGDYHGGGELSIDALLGGPALNSSAADLLVIAGDVEDDVTIVNVNDVAPGVAGQYNPNGIPVIGVLSGNTELGDFVLANGPIDKGLFSYDLFLDSPDDPALWTPGAYPDAKAWVLASYADSSAYMLAQSVGITQRMWHTTADGWIDRSGDLRDAYGMSGVSTANADWVAPVAPPAAPVVDSNDNGVWMRAIGLYAQSDNNYSFAPFPGQTVNVNGDYNESLWAIEGGVDHAFHLSNSTLVVGLLGGYVSNDVEFSGPGDSGTYAGPMAGIYASWIKGAGYIDALIKADFLNADLTVGGAPVSTDVLGIGGRVEAGYRFSMASGFYIEPVGSLAYLRTTFDEVFVGGTPISWEDGDSLRGKIGGRIGGTYNMANGLLEPYLKAYVGNEFMGDNSVFLASGPGVTVADDIGGVFGEVGLGFNWANTANNWSFFGQATYTFAEDYQAGDGKLGLRYAW